jgi:hypothetical protein
MLRFCHWQITLSDAKRSSGWARRKQLAELMVRARPLKCRRNSLTSRVFNYLFQIFSHHVLPPLPLGTVPRRFICVRMSAMCQPVRSAS